MNLAESIYGEIKKLDIDKALALVADRFPEKVVFSTSFGWEDQALSHMIFSNHIPIKVFTLETGRLFPETYYVWNRTIEKYGQRIQAMYPHTGSVEKMVSQKGPASFYESVENRKECCGIRKIEPLKRALAGNEIWITGIRAEQSLNRENMQAIEWDASNRIIKFHPLFDWSLGKVQEYIKENNVPYNPLHDKGFPSIGCAPCTRAVQDGEDFRAGRWWWEDQDKKECGLHSCHQMTGRSSPGNEK